MQSAFVREAEARGYVNCIISIDADGQDDIHAMDAMIEAYRDGSEVVYGVRSSREKDTWFKRTSAQMYYRLLKRFGGDVVYNHADYRLVSSTVLDSFADFHEVYLFLRGLFPLIGFRSSTVRYTSSSSSRCSGPFTGTTGWSFASGRASTGPS